MTDNQCSHLQVTCVNEYELIRKYRCEACGELMMCACDERHGRRFLPHQLGEGSDYATKERVAVTIGFQPSVCRECRGLSPVPFPKASLVGATSKIKRFYWRELHFREFDLLEQQGATAGSLFSANAPFDRKEIQAAALADIKALHATKPKYSLTTESEADFLARVPVDIVTLHPRILGHGKLLRPDGTNCSAEEFASDWLKQQGFNTLESESIPFHALFAVLLWMLIQDPSDPLVRIVGFGDRTSFEEKGQSTEQIWTHLPEDFGGPGYSRRRAADIDLYFEEHLQGDTDDLLFVFDLGLDPSHGLRQYLWAHRDVDVERARQILSVLPPDSIRQILRYLLDDYWNHYLGWPDLFAWNQTGPLFVEVKLSKDKLSEEQRCWVEANNSNLHLPFKLLKLVKAPKTSFPS